MAQVIKLKRSAVAGKTPQTSSLELGELAVNTNDGKIYLHRSSSSDDSIQSVLTTDATITGSLKLSGSQHISGSTNVMDDLSYGGNLSASLGSTSSFDRFTSVGTSSIGFLIATGSNLLNLTEAQTGSFASGSDVQQILDESGSYLVDADTGSLGNISGSINSTASFGAYIGDGSQLSGVTAGVDATSVSGSFLGLFSGSDDLTLGGGISGSIVSTASFGLYKGDGSGLSNVTTDTTAFASGSDLHQILAESSSYVVESETGSFVVNSQTGSFSSGSDLQVILAESASYVVSTNTGSFLQNSDTASFATLVVQGDITTSGSVVAQQFRTEFVSESIIFASGSTKFGDDTTDKHRFSGSIEITGDVSGSITSTASFGTLELDNVTGLPFASGSDLHQILAESSSYVVESETGSFASGSDLQTILAESASYLNNNSTSSLGKLTLVSDITGSITSTGSFGRVDVAENTFILGNLGIGTSTQGNRLQVAGDATIVGALDVLNSVSGGLSSTGSFGHVEQLGVKLVDSNQTASFASGSDFHQILTESSSYLVNTDTGSLGTTTINSTLFVQDGITTSGSITAREFKTEFVSSSIIYASGSNQFGDTGDDVHEFSGSLKIGNLTFSTSSIGIQSDTDLISLSDDTFTLNGSIVINDGANIGIDSDTDLLDLNDQNLIINGKLDSTGRIDAQDGLQVSGSTLAVGNDLTLNYTSPVSHSLVFVNHTNKTVDLVPAASASGQLVQYDGSDWVISDEIDGGSY